MTAAVRRADREARALSAAASIAGRGGYPSVAAVARLLGWSHTLARGVIEGLQDDARWPHRVRAKPRRAAGPVGDDPRPEELARRAAEIRADWDEERLAGGPGGIRVHRDWGPTGWRASLPSSRRHVRREDDREL
jgi:hypothetical protein